MTSAAAQKILSLERRGKVELELRQQEVWKAAREQEARDLEALAHMSLLEQQEKSLAKDRERDALAAVKRAQVQESLREQLAEREYAVMMEEEAKALEGAHMLALERAQVAKAEAAKAARREYAKKSALEVAEANKAFAARDLARAEAAAEEERMIVEYMRAKEAREREGEERRKAEKAAKDALGSKLSQAQKRVADGQQALDDARNRRHWEAVELAQRAKAKAALEAKERSKKECFEAISRQMDIRAQHQEEARLVDLEEAEAARKYVELSLQREQAEKERRRAVQAKAAADLGAQKRAAEAAAELEKRRPLEERRKQKLVELAQERVVEVFKKEVTGRMQSQRLPSQYVAAAVKVPNGLL